MRHRKKVVKLGRTAAHRDAMLRNMVTSLFEKRSITTTVHKAKALRPLTDKLVGLAKKGDLNAFRRAAGIITRRKILKSLFSDVKERNFYKERDCGYSTMGRVGLRKGDAAVMVKVSLIGPDHKKVKTGGGAKAPSDRSRRVAASKVKTEKAEAKS
ncbi:MAG: 50S ribosomal protein L17 [Deltaproteobacteria bacterium]|jgi:large subunit ribosomal protein L17|nr:50S ribosomal protein L17 [Deltaproteobacteria bacterium]